MSIICLWNSSKIQTYQYANLYGFVFFSFYACPCFIPVVHVIIIFVIYYRKKIRHLAFETNRLWRHKKYKWRPTNYIHHLHRPCLMVKQHFHHFFLCPMYAVKVKFFTSKRPCRRFPDLIFFFSLLLASMSLSCIYLSAWSYTYPAKLLFKKNEV